MEKMPAPVEREDNVEGKEGPKNPNRIFEWGVMIKNRDVLTTSNNVYRSVQFAALDDLERSGVVRNAGSAGAGPARKYGDRVYWTRGKDGEFHNVQEGHALLEAPLDIASSRAVIADDLVGIHVRGADGSIENIRLSPPQLDGSTEEATVPSTDEADLLEVRNRLGLPPQ